MGFPSGGNAGIGTSTMDEVLTLVEGEEAGPVLGKRTGGLLCGRGSLTRLATIAIPIIDTNAKNPTTTPPTIQATLFPGSPLDDMELELPERFRLPPFPDVAERVPDDLPAGTGILPPQDLHFRTFPANVSETFLESPHSGH